MVRSFCPHDNHLQMRKPETNLGEPMVRPSAPPVLGNDTDVSLLWNSKLTTIEAIKKASKRDLFQMA